MTILSWRDEYRIGIREVDAQHKYLFDLINALHDAHAAAESHSQLAVALTRLVAYAEEHFSCEEGLMAANSYPRLDQHRQLHESLVSSIFDLNEKFHSGLRQIDAEVLRFLKNWLVDHILHADMDFGSFMECQAAKAGKAAQGAAKPAPTEEKGEATETS